VERRSALGIIVELNTRCMPEAGPADKGIRMITTHTSSNIIPFPQRGSFCQHDLFQASTTIVSTGIVGLIIKRVHAPCRYCGGVHFIIGSSAAMHSARLTCAECNAWGGWMSRGEFNYAAMTLAKLGTKDR
jgi:hypothetical protein